MNTNVDNTIQQSITSCSVCLWFIMLIFGLLLIGVNPTIGVYVISCSMIIPTVGIIIWASIIIKKHCNKKATQYVEYNMPYNIKPPIIIKMHNNTYAIGIPMETQPRMYPNVPVYVAYI